MSSRLSVSFKVAVVCALLALSACASGGSAVPAPTGAATTMNGMLQPLSNGGPGGGTGGGVPTPGGGVPTPVVGGLQVPPSTTDAASWFISVTDPVTATCSSANVDFDCLQNMGKHGIPVGTKRSTTLLVYNISKKTPLRVASATFTGANAGDFSIATANLQTLLATTVPANQRQAELLTVSFSPSAAGVRTGTLKVVSDAGTALVALTGTGLPQRPLLNIPTNSTLRFIPTSAPANLTVENLGGQSLNITSITITGPNAASFGFFTTNRGFSNCAVGSHLTSDLLAPFSSCFIAVGITPGAPVPSTATLVFTTNDPFQPATDVHLTLTH